MLPLQSAIQTFGNWRGTGRGGGAIFLRRCRSVFEEHIGLCPECADYLANYRQTVAMGKSVCDPESSAPEDAPEALIQAILRARSEAG